MEWILLVAVVGLLRIAQANCNKATSGDINTRSLHFRYGALYEGTASILCFAYLTAAGFPAWNTGTVLCALASSFFFVTELITILEAMKGAPLVLCNMCAMGGGIIIVSIAGIFFFGEPMSLMQWLGVAAFFAAAYCLSPREKSDKKMTGRVWMILLCNFLINGAAGIIGKYFAVRVENGNAVLFTALTFGISALAFLAMWLLAKGKTVRSEWNAPMGRKLYGCGALLGLICAVMVCLNTSLARTVPVVILNTVPSAISIIGCLLVGALVFKEKITARNAVGVALGILSVVLIV